MKVLTVERRIEELLIRLKDDFPIACKRVNRLLEKSGDETQSFTQSLSESDTLGRVPTLDSQTQRPMSAMLRSRFRFCGRWRRLGEVWLSLSQMETVTRNRQFRKHFRSKKEYWEGSAPATIPLNRLSVFSVGSHAQGDYTFLVWPSNSTDSEPELWCYSGQSEMRFKDLESFLIWIADDSVEAADF